MSEDRRIVQDLFKRAAKTVTQDRPGVHGGAEDSFTMIAQMWTVYLHHLRAVRGHNALQSEDVAQMMTLLKKSRAIYGDLGNEDNFVDDMGYASLAGMLQLDRVRKTDTDKPASMPRATPKPNPNLDPQSEDYGEFTAEELLKKIYDKDADQ